MSRLKKALNLGIFDADVKEDAKSLVEEREYTPLWIKILAGGNLDVPSRVISVAQDAKEWAEKEKNNGDYIQ